MLSRRRPSSTPSRSPSDDLSHVGRADAAKKMKICQIKERLPRIARLAHLNTQTPRTPRTPRAKNSTTTAENKRVGRRWSPPGGLQFAAHRRCAKRAGHSATSLQAKCPDQSQRANLKGQALYARPGSCSPLFFSPQEGGDHRNPPLNLRILRLVGSLGLIFCSSETLFKIYIEKTSKNV